MKKRYIFILLVVVTVISSLFIFSNIVEAETVTIRTCENGPNNADSGGCGTACVNLCNESSFYSDSAGKALCSQQANDTRAWRKYRAIRTTSYIWECTAFPCYEQARHTISMAFMNNLCSTGDKCYGERCADGGGSPYLRPGHCDCGRVGPTPYKICCMNGIPVNAIWARGILQDGYSPEEGMCPGGFEPPVGVLTCAGSAFVDINANPLNLPLGGGQSTLTWTSAGAENCSISQNIGSVSPNGSRSVSLTATTTYTLTCRQAGSSPPISMSDSVTVTVGDAGATGCTITNFSASPTSISTGGLSTLSWSVTGASGCSISGIGSVGPSGSRTVTPASTTTYTLRCNGITGGTCSRSAQVVVNLTGCIPGPSSVTADVGATRACLPFQPSPAHDPPLQARQTSITWSGSVQNVCPAIIGGGYPTNNSIVCTSTSGNWSLANSTGHSSIGNQTGEGPYEPDITQTYSIGCTRHSYTCSSTQVFEGSRGNNDDNCRNRLNALLGGNHSANIDTDKSSCSREDCDVRWNAGSNPDGSQCAEWRWSQCWLDPLDNACVQGTLDCALRNCPPRLECLRYNCRYHKYNLSVTSKPICASSATDSQVVRVIQKPGIPTNQLEINPPKTQILLNQFINLRWSVTNPNSGTPTTLRCTPSIGSGGDGTGWTTATFPSFTTPGGLFSRTVSNLSPARTTRYQLVCRNSDDIAPNQCFYDSDLRARDIKVFTPDLREVPASPR